jgi:hypothetical protein
LVKGTASDGNLQGEYTRDLLYLDVGGTCFEIVDVVGCIVVIVGGFVDGIGTGEVGTDYGSIESRVVVAGFEGGFHGLVFAA